MNKKVAATAKQKPVRPRLDLESSFGNLSENATTRSEVRFATPGVNRAERASQLVRQHPSAFEGSTVTASTQIDNGEAVPLFNAASYVVGRNYRVPLALLDFNTFGARVYYRASDVDRISMSFADSSDESSKQKVAANGWVRPDGRIELDDGGTRLRAARASGLEYLEVKIVAPPASARDQFKRSKALNDERSSQTALDLAVMFRKLLDEGVYANQDELAADIKDAKGNALTKSAVSMYLRIEKIPDRLRRIMVEHDQTSHFTIAYEISALFTADDLPARREHYEIVAEEVIREVQSKNLGKQQVIELVRSKLHGPKSRTRPENKRVEVAGKPGLIKVFQARGQVDFSVKGLDEESLKVLVDGIEQLCKGQLPLNTP
jgi:ParB family chromosome partitioning protein